MLEQRSRALGAVEHHLVDARTAYFEQVLTLPDHGQRAPRESLPALRRRRARAAGADRRAVRDASSAPTSLAHGSTAAGNDQVRFEVALRTLAPGLEILAPVRDRAFKRPEQLEYLKARGLPVPPFGAAYSVNRGLWGVTIGGKETLVSRDLHPGRRLGADARRVHAAARRRSGTRSASRPACPCSLDGARRSTRSR